MKDHLIRDLDFDAILEIVAAHARSELGRSFLCLNFSDRECVRERCQLSREFSQVLEEGENLGFSGLDEALPFLEEESLMPTEAKELLVLLSLTRRIQAVRKRLGALDPDLGGLRELGLKLPDLSELIRWVAPRLGRDGQIPDHASPALKSARQKITRVRRDILKVLEGIRKSHGDAVTDAPPTLRRDRYCLPVKASARGKIPGLLLDFSGSGLTVFMEPFAAVEANNELAAALATEREEVHRILREIAMAFGDMREELLDSTRILGLLDAVQAALLFGRRIGGRLVDPQEDVSFILRRARHPLLDERLSELRSHLAQEQGERNIRGARKVIPLDFRMGAEERTLIISGPNAGGKTVVLKTIGVMVLLAYHGIPLPVDEGSSIPWFEHLWCRIGDDQDVSADLSTFSGAMTATAELFEKAGSKSLIIYDELGTGTDPMEGAALGCALLEELTRRSSLTIATTHLAPIAMEASSNPGMANAAMEYDEEAGRPTYRLRMGRPGRSRGLEIAESVGIPSPIISRARELLGGQHLELDRALRRLEEVENQTRRERDAALQERIRMESESLKLKKAREEIQSERELLPERLKTEREKLRMDARRRLDKALKDLDLAQSEGRHLGRRARQKLRDEAMTEVLPARKAGAKPPEDLREGMEVHVFSLQKTGVLSRLAGKQALVEIGATRIWVPLADLEHRAGTKPAAPSPRVAVENAGDREREIKLLGLDSTEARERLEYFLDRADAGGLRTVRVVHGHGTGTLRRMVAEVLREHPAVTSFSHPPRNRGGTGATEALLRE